MFGRHTDTVRGMTGILLPFMEARVLREDGSDADYDEVGELVLRSPTVALGYRNNDRRRKKLSWMGGYLQAIVSTSTDKSDSCTYPSFSLFLANTLKILAFLQAT